MDFYFEILINTTKNIKINQQLVIFNQWIVGKQLFQITIMCDYGHRFNEQLDSQQSIPYSKRENVTSTPQPFTFGPQFLVLQTKNFIDENFVSLGKCTDSGFKFLSLLLFGKILWISLQRFYLIMTFFGEPLEGKRWQSSTKVWSIGTSISSKISKSFDSRSLSATLAGIPKISRYSLLEYCSLA